MSRKDKRNQLTQLLSVSIDRYIFKYNLKIEREWRKLEE